MEHITRLSGLMTKVLRSGARQQG